MKLKKFAVFDLDGTLIRWQLFHAVINRMAKEGILGDTGYGKIKAARLQWKRRSTETSFDDYENTLVEVYFQALPNISVEKFDAAVVQTLEEYKDQRYVFTNKLLHELKSKGYFVMAISGSHLELVEHIASHYGFDDWVGSVYEKKDGKFTGKREVSYENKHLILDKLIKKHGLTSKDSVAVGDTKGDITMLAAVEQPIAFNPTLQLFEHAKSHGWKIVVERKNVIYELEARDGTYFLA